MQTYTIAPPGAEPMEVQIVEHTDGGTALVGTKIGSGKWRYSSFDTYEDALDIWGQR